MMEGWREIKLKNLAITFIDGDRSSKYPKRSEFQKEGVIFLNANSISKGQFEKSNVNYISKTKFDTIQKGRISLDDVVMTTRGNGVGDCYYHKVDFGEGLINAQMLILRCDKTELNPQFLYYQFISERFKKLVENYSSGSAQPQLPIGSLKAIPILFPPLPTQRKIATILSAYDDLIENNLKRIKILEEKAQLTYEEWFVRMKFPGHETTPINEETGLPEGWEKKKIGDICKISGGGTPSKAIDSYWNDGDIIWFSPTDLSKSGSLIQLDSSAKITPLGLQKSSAKLLQANSFMMTSRATIGLFGLIDKPFCTNQGFINVTPASIVDKEYLIYNFKKNIVLFINYATGATFLEISKSVFNKIKIVWPPVSIIKNYHSIVEVIHKNMLNLTNQNQRLKEARDLLLPRLMTGMIDVEQIKIENPITK